MKKIGIVGGIGWPSTIEYYKLICEASLSHHKGQDYLGPCPMPEISIESLDINFTINNRGNDEPDSWCRWDQYFNDALLRLEASDCDLVVLASVTPHSRLNQITTGLSVPLLSVYEAVAQECKDKGINKLLILGTSQTMNTLGFINAMEEMGVIATYPKTIELKQKIIDVISELYENRRVGSEKIINEVVRSCIESKELERTAICLACTELPLAFR